MPEEASETLEMTYPLGAASRLTGLSPELLRAWERRYGVVQPIRTPGGTRRYTAADLERLRLVKAVVDAGHRIGQVAGLDEEELRIRAAVPDDNRSFDHGQVLAALERLDGVEAQRLLSIQLAVLGSSRFAAEVAGPLLREIGERWAAEQLGIASEHLATSLIRSLLGSAMQPTAASTRGPSVIFATPSDERHELGLQMAALSALGAGADPIYLGTDIPAHDLAFAAKQSGAVAVALSIVTLPAGPRDAFVASLRRDLSPSVPVWLGGAGAGAPSAQEGVEVLASLEDLEQRIARLRFDLGQRF